MDSTTNEAFFGRSDAHIDLANDQLQAAAPGEVSASMMYAVARFNAWLSACSFDEATEMQQAKEDIIAYFTGEYRSMLEEHIDDYIAHFSEFVTPEE
ncbi:MAG: DUF3144 domain-containing protein [Saprospiraceae bacterium]